MSQASDYLENKLIDHLFRGTSFAKPPALYIGLFTAMPSDVGGGTEVAGGGYARVALAPTDSNWKATQGGTSGASAGTGGVTSNAVGVAYPVPTGNWGTVVAIGIFDAPTTGNLLVWAPLAASRQIINGDPAPTFGVDALTVTIA
jgi:hypothetical protein